MCNAVIHFCEKHLSVSFQKCLNLSTHFCLCQLLQVTASLRNSLRHNDNLGSMKQAQSTGTLVPSIRINEASSCSSAVLCLDALFIASLEAFKYKMGVIGL